MRRGRGVAHELQGPTVAARPPAEPRNLLVTNPHPTPDQPCPSSWDCTAFEVCLCMASFALQHCGLRGGKKKAEEVLYLKNKHLFSS